MNFDSNVVVQSRPEIEDSFLSKLHPDPWEVELATLPGTSRVTILPRGWNPFKNKQRLQMRSKHHEWSLPTASF